MRATSFEGLDANLAQARFEPIALLLLGLLLKQTSDLRGPQLIRRCLAPSTASGSAKCTCRARHCLFRIRLIGVLAAMMASVTAVSITIIIITTSRRCRSCSLVWWWPLFLWWSPVTIFILPSVSIAIPFRTTITPASFTSVPVTVVLPPIRFSSALTTFSATSVPISVIITFFTITPSSRIILVIGLIFHSMFFLHPWTVLHNLLLPSRRLCRLWRRFLPPFCLFLLMQLSRSVVLRGCIRLITWLPTRCGPLEPLTIFGLLPHTCTNIIPVILLIFIGISPVAGAPSALQHHTGCCWSWGCRRGWRTSFEVLHLFRLSFSTLLAFTFSFRLSPFSSSFGTLRSIGLVASFAGITLSLRSFGSLALLALWSFSSFSTVTITRILLRLLLTAVSFTATSAIFTFFFNNLFKGFMVDLGHRPCRTLRLRLWSSPRSLIPIIRLRRDEGSWHWNLSCFRSRRNHCARLSRLLSLRWGYHTRLGLGWRRLSRSSRILLLWRHSLFLPWRFLLHRLLDFRPPPHRGAPLPMRSYAKVSKIQLAVLPMQTQVQPFLSE